MRATALALALASARAEGTPQPLDARAIQELMAGSSPAVVRFDAALPGPEAVRVWEALADDFGGTALSFGTVNCAEEAAACAARKVAFASDDDAIGFD